MHSLVFTPYVREEVSYLIEVNKTNFEEEVLKSEGLVMVDFGAQL